MKPNEFIKNDKVFNQWKSCRSLLCWDDIEILMTEFSKSELKEQLRLHGVIIS